MQGAEVASPAQDTHVQPHGVDFEQECGQNSECGQDIADTRLLTCEYHHQDGCTEGHDCSAEAPGGGVAEAAAEEATPVAAPAGPSPASSETSSSALLDLLDEGWFQGNLLSVGGWYGGVSLSTIKEEQGETEEQVEEEEDQEASHWKERVEAEQDPRLRTSRSPEAHFCSASRDQGEISGEHKEAFERSRDTAAHEYDGVSARRRGSSPYSSDEETVQKNRQGRRRSRNSARRRPKRSSSAENARGSWLDPPQEGSGEGAGLARKPLGCITPPLRSIAAPVEERDSQPRFLRTRSVSDYDARGPRATSLWDTPPGSRSTSRSLTDADVEELQGFFDLGFKFPQDQISPQITATLPALRLYQKIGTVQQRLLQQQQEQQQQQQQFLTAAPNPGRTTTSPSSPAEIPGGSLRADARSSSLPTDNSWTIADPSDNPVDVKTNLRFWAQAVASTVRQTC